MNSSKHTPPPPGFCSVHGLFPIVGLFSLGSGSSIKLQNCATRCPSPGCGEICEILPGTYRSVDKDRLEFLLDPSISPAALEALKKIFEGVRDGKLSPAQAESEALRVVPQAAGLFRNWTRTEVIALGALIATVAGVIIAKTTPPASTTVTVQPVIERVIKTSDADWMSSSALSKVPMPKPRPNRH